MQISGKAFAIVVALVVVVICAFTLMSKTGGPTEADSVPIIGTGIEYNKILMQAEEMTKDVFEKINRDEELTFEDKAKLSKAASLFQGLRAFEPERPGPYIALGLIFRGLSQPKAAEEALNLCLRTLGGNTSPEFLATSAEVHYQLSRVMFDAQKFDNAIAEASTAIQAVPDNPAYLTARAAAYLQSKRIDEAKQDLKAALKLDPSFPRAKTLMRLIH